MSQPSISDARAITDKHKQAGVIILAFSLDGQVALASYGDTKKICGRLKGVGNDIFERLMSGEIPVDLD